MSSPSLNGNKDDSKNIDAWLKIESPGRINVGIQKYLAKNRKNLAGLSQATSVPIENLWEILTCKDGFEVTLETYGKLEPELWRYMSGSIPFSAELEMQEAVEKRDSGIIRLILNELKNKLFFLSETTARLGGGPSFEIEDFTHGLAGIIEDCCGDLERAKRILQETFPAHPPKDRADTSEGMQDYE